MFYGSVCKFLFDSASNLWKLFFLPPGFEEGLSISVAKVFSIGLWLDLALTIMAELWELPAITMIA